MGLNKEQRDYWYPKIEKKQVTLPTIKRVYKKSPFLKRILFSEEPIPEGSGEFCWYCGALPKTLEKNGLDPIMMISHDDNNKYNTTLPNLFFTCRGCNRRKDPHPPNPQKMQMSQSEATNKRAEKPWVDWLYNQVRTGKSITWIYAVSEGAFKFDISTDTIEKRYYRKYFEAPSGPFELIRDNDLGQDIVVLKDIDVERANETVSNPHPITSTD